jgi:arabinogalactan oligomer / maltooligosaccharide transport system substrate-binding protein
MKSFNIRSLIALVCLTFLLISARPSPSYTNPSDKSPEVTNAQIYLPLVKEGLLGQYSLEMWVQWDGAYFQEYENVLADFQSIHPNISIDVAKPDDIYSALKAAIPAGQGPDIVGWSTDHIGALANDGFIVSLDPYFSWDYLTANFEPVTVNGNLWKGQIWGIPDTQEGIVLVYNKALVSSDQLPNPDDFTDLLLKAGQFENSHPGKYYLCSQGLGSSDAYHAAPIYFGFGINQYIDENGLAYMNTQASLNAANWIKDFRPYGMAVSGYDYCNTELINGDIAIWWTGPWAIAGLQSHGVDFGIASMGRPFVGIKNYMMTVNAVSRGNTPAVIALLEYLGSPEVQKRLTLVNKTIPANTAALNDPSVLADWIIAGFSNSLRRGTPMGTTPYITCQWVPIGDATLSIWSGTKTPAQAMNDAQTAIDTCVANMNTP